eukprot:jgi/Astpho2/1770/fgenesh1_pg.00034_%23_1_t
MTSWIVTMTGLQQEHDIHCLHQLNQLFHLPKQLRTQMAPWLAPVRRNHGALAHTVAHCTLQMTHVMKRERGDRTHRASRHPGPAEMPPFRMISDDRLSELWSIYQCPYSARCACNVEIVQPPLTLVGTGRRPDSLLLHEKACVVLLASLLVSSCRTTVACSTGHAASCQDCGLPGICSGITVCSDMRAFPQASMLAVQAHAYSP